MEKPIEDYWTRRLTDLKETLEKNNFDVFLAHDSATARDIVLEEIIPKAKPESISWGGSLTLHQTKLYNSLKNRSDLKVLDAFDKALSPAEAYELRRQALLVDLFITGTNAVTEAGQLVNLDMVGNRVAALTFGPKAVVVLLGRNKLVNSLEDAMIRIKSYSAPVNTRRLDKKTPCAKTAICAECSSPDRICNHWTITEKSFPKGRIRVVLINEDLGF
ncbi:MAG: lactate utilization protein [Desulfobacterales bacterium]|nr:lactate utilization protein [Desulfobacterales bacterium]